MVLRNKKKIKKVRLLDLFCWGITEKPTSPFYHLNISQSWTAPPSVGSALPLSSGLPAALLFNLRRNIKARSFKYKGRYCCVVEQSLSDTWFNNRISSRLRPNSRDHNAFMAAIVNSIFKFHPTLALAYWSVIWSAELLTRPRVITACRRDVLFFFFCSLPGSSHQRLHYAHLKPGK